MTLNQSNGIHLSLNVPFNTKGTLKFVAEGSFKYELVSNFEAKTSDLKMIPDLDLFKFSGKWTVGKGIVALDLGRFTISDIYGYTFAQKSDGLSLSYDALKYKFGLYAGYTGLQNRLNVTMLNNPQEDANFYAVTAGYVPVMVNLAYKTLFETHTIGFQGEAFIPVNTEDKTKYVYGTLMMNGPIGVIGAYTLKGTVGLSDFKDLMVDGGLDVNFYLANTAIMILGGEFVSYESGALHYYKSITGRTITTDPLFAGGVLPKLSFIYAKNSVLTSVTGKGVLGVIPGVSDELKFHGADITASLICNVFSDLQVGCDLGAFVAVDEVVKNTIKNNKSNVYYATIRASLAF